MSTSPRRDPGTPRVDAHHHLWDLAARPQEWLDGEEMTPIRRDFTEADLGEAAASAGVRRTVLVQVLPDVDETLEFLALAAGSELIAGVVGWVDLTAPDVASELARLRSAPGGHLLVGVRHLVQSEPDPSWLVRPDVLAGLRAVRDAGLAYDLLTVPHQLPAAVEAVRAVPDLRFVLDHLSKPDIAGGSSRLWADRLRTLADEPNVVAKLSGLVTEADRDRWTVDDLRPYVETALESFGPDRLAVGSDWPVCLLAADYARVFAAAEELLSGCSPDEVDQVFGGTATRVYGLAGR
ncbi:amidohydrolase family protein [Actinosynnema sp. NPDC023658]|uniref:amidohydrolase family protein n=1 Tax=Actinosynnema sp. NPDC023658 TaxID=3155465 RepID=UPI0033D820D3